MQTIDDVFRVTFTHIVELLKFYWKNTYVTSIHNKTHDDILQFIELMWARDYSCLKISNEKGQLCPNYPAQIFVPDAHCKTVLRNWSRPYPSVHVYDSVLNMCVPKADRAALFSNKYMVLSEVFKADKNKPKECTTLAVMENFTSLECCSPLHPPGSLEAGRKVYFKNIEERRETLQRLMSNAIYGRSRHRIVVPVILYKGVYVSRSATIPIAGELLFRKTMNLVADPLTAAMDAIGAGINTLMPSAKPEEQEDGPNSEMSQLDQARAADVLLLKHLKIKTIFDLMVEDKKICYNAYTATSEKATKGDDVNHYAEFNINQVPFPGCEFFEKFGKSLDSENLFFDWSTPEVNSTLRLESEHLKKLNTEKYSTWSLEYMTKKYLLIMLTHLKEGVGLDDGLLVHCISGWDRTPLFVSLLRISLWADDTIHQSMNPAQMLYFTLAYDWMFFSHDLKKRALKGEMVLLFCFYVLKFIKGEHFNIESESFGDIEEYKLPTKPDKGDKDDKRKCPDETLSATPASPTVFSISLENSPEAKTTDRQDNDSFEVVSLDGRDEEEYLAQMSLEEKLGPRGASSPTVPGEYMAGRTNTIRYKRITYLRKLFFDAFKAFLACEPDVKYLETTKF